MHRTLGWIIVINKLINEWNVYMVKYWARKMVLWVKAFARRLNPSSVPRIRMVEGDPNPASCVFWLPHIHTIQKKKRKGHSDFTFINSLALINNELFSSLALQSWVLHYFSQWFCEIFNVIYHHWPKQPSEYQFYVLNLAESSSDILFLY